MSADEYESKAELMPVSRETTIATGIHARSPTAYAVADQTFREGGLPSLIPKVLLQTPMWLDPRSKQRVENQTSYVREYWDVEGGPGLPPERVHRIVQIHNAWRATAQSPYGAGLLTYGDLDVLMALTWGMVETGKPIFVIEQGQVLRLQGLLWNQISGRHYEALRDSIARLKYTQVVLGKVGDHAPVAPFHLLTPNDSPLAEQDGKHIHVQLNPLWFNALTQENWQMVDLESYARLVGIDRRYGLPRVIYLFLRTWRRSDGTFEVPWPTLVDRYGLRDPQGKLRALRPSSKSCAVAKALRFLESNGVIKIDGYGGGGVRSQRATVIGHFVGSHRRGLAGSTQTNFLTTEMFQPGVPERLETAAAGPDRADATSAIPFAATDALTPELLVEGANACSRCRRQDWLTPAATKRALKNGLGLEQLFLIHVYAVHREAKSVRSYMNAVIKGLDADPDAIAGWSLAMGVPEAGLTDDELHRVVTARLADLGVITLSTAAPELPLAGGASDPGQPDSTERNERLVEEARAETRRWQQRGTEVLAEATALGLDGDRTVAALRDRPADRIRILRVERLIDQAR